MNDNIPAPVGQEPISATEGQEPTVNTPTTSETPEPKSWFDSLPAEAQAEVKRLRSESAAHRKGKQDAERVAEETRLANLTEVERAREEAKKAVEERDALVNDLRKEKILNAARAKGAVDPDAVFALLDKDSIEWEGAKSANLDESIEALLAAKTYLKANNTPAVPSLNPPSPGRSTGTNIPEFANPAERMRWAYENSVKTPRKAK